MILFEVSCDGDSSEYIVLSLKIQVVWRPLRLGLLYRLHSAIGKWLPDPLDCRIAHGRYFTKYIAFVYYSGI